VKLYKLTASTNPDSTGQQENTVPNWSFQHRQNISTEDNPVTPYPILAAPKHCQNLRPKKKTLPELLIFDDFFALVDSSTNRFSCNKKVQGTSNWMARVQT
jgi:hypothetical protein